jgi:hypothetical protein
MPNVTMCPRCGLSLTSGPDAGPPCSCVPAASPRVHEFRILDTGCGWGIRQGPSQRVAPRVGPPTPVHPATARARRLGNTSGSPSARLLSGYGATPPEPRRRSPAIQAGILFVAFSALGMVSWAGWSGGALGSLSHTARPLTSPVAIGALTQVVAPQADTLALGVHPPMAGSTVPEGPAVAGVYGTNNVPKLILVASPAKEGTQTTAQLTGAVNASGTPFAGAPTVSSLAGQQYVCGKAGTAHTAPAVICAWTDPAATGVVVNMNTTDVPGTLTLTAQARTATER